MEDFKNFEEFVAEVSDLKFLLKMMDTYHTSNISDFEYQGCDVSRSQLRREGLNHKERKKMEDFKNFEEFVAEVSDLKLMHKMMDTYQSSNFSHFKYQGFDASRLMQTFWRHCDQKNGKSMMTDLYDMLLIGLMRANIRVDQLAKTPIKVRGRIKELSAKYNIPMKKNKSDQVKLSPDTLTFVRMINIFPLQASILIHHDSKLVFKSQLTGKYGGNSCPYELRHSGAASIIPDTEAAYPYFLIHVAYMMEIGELIDKTEMTVVQRFEKQRRFASLALKSNTVSVVNRIAAFKAMGLDKKDVFDEVIKGIEILREIRGLSDLKDSEKKVRIVADKVFISDSELTDSEASSISLKMLFFDRLDEVSRGKDGASSSKLHTGSMYDM